MSRNTKNPLTGIALMCAAVACFPIMQSCVKTLLLEHQVSFVQATWGRYVFHLLLVPVFFPGVLKALTGVDRIALQVSRGVALFIGTGCAFLSLRYLALPQVTALSFVAPITVTVLAALFLSERVGWRRWCAVVVGFVGVAVIVRPGTSFTWPVLLPLAMAGCYSVYQVLTRAVRMNATPAVSLFFTALVGAVGASVAVPFWWVWPSVEGWALLVGAALAGGLGHWFMILAYERSQASFIAPFAYTELIWAALLGYLIFDQTPDSYTWMGASIIVASGLYIAHREVTAKS